MAVANPKAAVNLTRGEVTTGLVLAGLVVTAWLVVHVAAIFFVDWSQPGLWMVAPLVIALQTWLSVGLFIVAHDSMHGSLYPADERINGWIGRICVALYAGFSYSRLYGSHHEHHRYAGTERDPDFDANHPTAFWPWYIKFFRTYFGWREFGVLTVVVLVYMLLLWQRWPNMLLFWALPAILSSFQLFYFGTFLPHRQGEPPFTDQHRSRSNDFPWIVSLLTCFHFGYHHEHHERPWVPWWKLPAFRDSLTSKRPAAV
jgi:beta-carotene/zeaxanthin 4-ketolase